MGVKLKMPRQPSLAARVLLPTACVIRPYYARNWYNQASSAGPPRNKAKLMHRSSPAHGSARRFLGGRSLRTLFLLLALLAALPSWQASLAAAAPVAQSQTEVQPPLEKTSPDAQYLGALPGSAAASQGGQRYFAQTGHFLRGRFLEFWEI